MTLSILAFDAGEHLVGAAVTSCVVAAGRRILHVRPGVGAAVTQASSEIVWGETSLDRLADGRSPSEAIMPFAAEATQVAVVDFSGLVAVHTGSECDPHAGHASASSACAQATPQHGATHGSGCLLRLSMRKASHLQSAWSQPSPHRAVMPAASNRPVSSCTSTTPLTGYADEPHVDLRVDDHREPVEELGRLLSLHRAHCAMRGEFARPDGPRAEAIGPLLERHPGDPHLRKALEVARRST
jgi:uncharacterized Ntn-hydrolase superfamily protein